MRGSEGRPRLRRPHRRQLRRDAAPITRTAAGDGHRIASLSRRTAVPPETLAARAAACGVTGGSRVVDGARRDLRRGGGGGGGPIGACRGRFAGTPLGSRPTGWWAIRLWFRLTAGSHIFLWRYSHVNHDLRHFRVAAITIMAALFAIASPAHGASSTEYLISKAEATLNDFQGDPQMYWIRDHIRDAKGVIIAPEIRKAGFVLGGSGGRAVLLARDPDTGNFSGPAFYTIASASIGFQAGIEKSEVVMLVMTDKALDRLLSSQLKLGGEASIAAGPVGEGAASSITSDIVAFSRSKGIYGGVNLE